MLHKTFGLYVCLPVTSQRNPPDMRGSCFQVQSQMYRGNLLKMPEVKLPGLRRSAELLHQGLGPRQVIGIEKERTIVSLHLTLQTSVHTAQLECNFCFEPSTLLQRTYFPKMYKLEKANENSALNSRLLELRLVAIICNCPYAISLFSHGKHSSPTAQRPLLSQAAAVSPALHCAAASDSGPLQSHHAEQTTQVLIHQSSKIAG